MLCMESLPLDFGAEGAVMAHPLRLLRDRLP